ncbi:MAG: HAMP domain-containing protein [Ignavibacteriales bacterium]|nr:HAMP domain-containing protein [Ignavibacteriales bacterium]
MKFEAHYSPAYPIFLGWYVVLLFLNVYWLLDPSAGKSRTEKPNTIFLAGLIISNSITFIFGLLLPWLLGFYFVVEISPLAFLVGFIIFSAFLIERYDLFQKPFTEKPTLSLRKKLIFIALVIVPIIVLLLQIPLAKILFPPHSSAELQKLFFIALMVGIIVSATITYLTMKLIAKPLELIQRSTVEIRRGNHAARINYRSNDEIGNLAVAFNEMVETLENNSEQMSQQQRRIMVLLNAFDKSIAGIVVTDVSGKIIEGNPQFCELAEVEMGVVVGQQFLVLELPSKITESYDALVHKLQIEGQISDEILYTSSLSGKSKVIYFTMTGIYNESAQFAGLLFVGIDITRRKQMEKELFNAEKLSALGKMAAILAHEIKTPLTSIKLNIDMLAEDTAIYTGNAESLEIIQREIYRIIELTKEILQFAKHMDLVCVTFLFDKLITEVLQLLDSQIKEKNISVAVHCESCLINADYDKLKQVFINLIENAIEAVNENEAVEISAQKVESGIRISVSNVGNINLDGELIFEPFYSSKHAGTGLGLSIAKKIIELHNGTIEYIPVNREKTTFEIWLPGRNNLCQKY